MMLLQKIHKMKWLQIVISVILCFALMFCMVSKSVEVKAVVGVDDGIFWAIVAALVEMGIVVDVSDPEVRSDVSDFFWSAADSVREDIEIMAAFVKVGYSVYYNASVEAWSRIANSISEWFTTERYPPSSIIYGNFATSTGTVDFFTQGSFSFTFPEMTSGTSYIVNFPFNDCCFTYYVNPPVDTIRTLKCLEPIGTSDYLAPTSNYLYCAISPNNYDIYYLWWYGNGYTTSNLSGKTFLNDAWNGVTSVRSWSLSSHSLNTNTPLNFFDSFSGYFYSNGSEYMLSAYNDKYAFVQSGSNGTVIYNNLTFDTPFLAVKWFFDACGINIDKYSPSIYVPGEIDTPSVVVDPVAVQNALDNIADLPEDATIPIILPGNETQYNQLVSSIPVSSLYDADIDMPTVDGNLWKTKFPFCIPFDLINLFSGFSAQAQAPSFHVLVMPANSFGLDNDDIYWDIDFAPYNYLVQILRFFIALGFLLWLIVITRKLIRG